MSGLSIFLPLHHQPPPSTSHHSDLKMSTRIVNADTHNVLLAGLASSIVVSGSAKQSLEALRNATVQDYRSLILQRVMDLERDALAVAADGADGDGANVNLEREILALKGGYNILSPISILPSEVLSNIFLIVALSQPRSIMAWSGTRRMPWIRVTHVCQYWRELALNCPALWSDVGFLEPDCMEVVFRRSKNAPLRVAAMNDRIASTAVFGKALSQTHRLLDVDIEVSSSALLGSLLSKLDGHAPLLQNLFIYCCRESAQLHVNVKKILRGADSLKQIGLQRCSISWRQIPFSATLTYLQLWNSDMKIHTHCRPSKGELIQSLKSMPHLEELDLFKFLPVAATDSGPHRSASMHPAAALPELTRLTVYDRPSELALFFATVELYRTTSIVIGFLDSWPDDVCPVLANFQACCKGTMLQKFVDTGLQTLDVSQFSGYDDHDIQFAQVDLRFDVGEWCKGSTTVSLLLPCDLPGLFLFDDYLSNLSDALDLSRLQALEIRRIDDDPLEMFLFAIRELPVLKSIAFQGSTIDGFVEGWASDCSGGGEGSPLPYPALSQIKFSEVEWCPFVVDGLAEVLHSRFEHPRLGPIELDIVACNNFGRAGYSKLQNSADNVKVVWDYIGSYACGGRRYYDEESEEEEDEEEDEEEEGEEEGEEEEEDGEPNERKDEE